MGEAENRIVVTGAPGLDTLLAAPQMTRSGFLSHMGMPTASQFRLVTVHPETNSLNPAAPLDAVLEALAARPAPTLFTATNSDPGGAAMRASISEFVVANEWAHSVDTLGSRLYPNALRHATLMLGNSSSGIVEAGLFGLPVINVGDRQKGRERGRNVLDVRNDAEAIIQALDRLGSIPRRFAAGTPYGEGGAGPKVAEVLARLPARSVLLEKQSVPVRAH
jgi:UDP-hydrolysing UDP-N-acetyl-D-glucosamine 2-epimerase